MLYHLLVDHHHRYLLLEPSILLKKVGRGTLVRLYPTLWLESLQSKKQSLSAL